MDVTSPVPILQVRAFDRVSAEWTRDPALMAVGVVPFVVACLVLAVEVWRRL